jgi:hypothetical protein
MAREPEVVWGHLFVVARRETNLDEEPLTVDVKRTLSQVTYYAGARAGGIGRSIPRCNRWRFNGSWWRWYQKIGTAGQFSKRKP